MQIFFCINSTRYPFLKRWKQSCREQPELSKLSKHLRSVIHDFVSNLKEMFASNGQYQNVHSSMFIKLNETAVYFESKSEITVHKMEAQTVPIWHSGSNDKRLTACVSVASSGEKMSLLLIFKVHPERTIEKLIKNFLCENVLECFQSNDWMNSWETSIWTEKSIKGLHGINFIFFYYWTTSLATNKNDFWPLWKRCICSDLSPGW